MTSSSIPARARALMALVVLLAVAAALAACGSSSSSTNTSAGASTTASATGPAGRPDFARLRACLQQQGVALPRRPAGGVPNAGVVGQGGGFRRGGGFFSRLSIAQRVRLQAAMQKCGGQFGGGFRRFGGPNVRSAAFRRALVAYVACVRRNGFALPAPNTSGSGPVFDPSKVNRQDPKFVAANAKCQQLLAAARPAPPAGAPPLPGQAGG
jgi:hypothetical protein